MNLLSTVGGVQSFPTLDLSQDSNNCFIFPNLNPTTCHGGNQDSPHQKRHLPLPPDPVKNPAKPGGNPNTTLYSEKLKISGTWGNRLKRNVLEITL